MAFLEPHASRSPWPYYRETLVPLQMPKMIAQTLSLSWLTTWVLAKLGCSHQKTRTAKLIHRILTNLAKKAYAFRVRMLVTRYVRLAAQHCLLEGTQVILSSIICLELPSSHQKSKPCHDAVPWTVPSATTYGEPCNGSNGHGPVSISANATDATVRSLWKS